MADRHDFLRLLLGGRPADQPQNVALGGYSSEFSRLFHRIQEKASGKTNFGAWSTDVVELTEELAIYMVREVSEWSVVYDREVLEV